MSCFYRFSLHFTRLSVDIRALAKETRPRCRTGARLLRAFVFPYSRSDQRSECHNIAALSVQERQNISIKCWYTKFRDHPWEKTWPELSCGHALTWRSVCLAWPYPFTDIQSRHFQPPKVNRTHSWSFMKGGLCKSSQDKREMRVRCNRTRDFPGYWL